MRQRTQLINALRGHLAEHSIVAPTGAACLNRLAAAISDEKTGLPEPVCQLGTLYLEQIEALSARVNGLDRQMRRLPPKLTALAGCKPCRGLGRSRQWNRRQAAARRDIQDGQRDIRRLLITGAMAAVQHASRAPNGSWLGQMLARNPGMLEAIALANKGARGLWAMITTNRDFKNPATAAA